MSTEIIQIPLGSGGPTTSPLSAILTNGNTTGEQSIISDNGYSTLGVLNGDASLSYNGGSGISGITVWDDYISLSSYSGANMTFLTGSVSFSNSIGHQILMGNNLSLSTAGGSSGNITLSSDLDISLVSASITTSTFVYIDSSDNLISLPNAAGALVNDGAGNFSWEGNIVGAQSNISASSIDWNYSHLYKTLSANTTFTFSNVADAKTIIISITNTVGNYTVTWPTGVLWTGGTEPVQTIGAKTDIYTLVQINGVIYGSYVQDLS